MGKSVAYMLAFGRFYMFGSQNSKHVLLECITHVDDLVHFVTHAIDNSSTDNIASDISACIKSYGISADQMMLLSELQRCYGEDEGNRGFVVNAVWCTVLQIILSKWETDQ